MFEIVTVVGCARLIEAEQHSTKIVNSKRDGPNDLDFNMFLSTLIAISERNPGMEIKQEQVTHADELIQIRRINTGLLGFFVPVGSKYSAVVIRFDLSQ